MRILFACLALVVFFHDAAALASSGFVPLSLFDRTQKFLLWVDGSELPHGAQWIIKPTSIEITNPAPAIGSSYMVFDSKGKRTVNYFLGADATAYFDKETVFVAWVFAAKKPEYIAISLHEKQGGWRGMFIGSRTETPSLKRVSLRLPPEGEWHALLLRAQDMFPETGSGVIDGLAVELTNGRVFFDSIALASDKRIPKNLIPEFSIKASKSSFLKGESMKISASSPQELMVTAFKDNKKIFSKTVVPDSSNAFSLDYTIGLSDPKGTWLLTASSTFNEAVEKIEVLSTKESESLSINFLSPLAAHLEKNSKATISAKVTLEGKPVSNAAVNVWGAMGERIVLANTGNGVYSTEYVIPQHAGSGQWELLATATAIAGKEIGGEAVIPITILEVPIVIELVEPKIKKFDFGEQLLLRVKALQGSTPASNAAARIELSMPVEGKSVFDLKQVDEGVFEAVLPTHFFSNNTLNVRVILASGIEKTEEATFQLRPNSYLFNFAKANMLFFVALLVILIIPVIVWVSRLMPVREKSLLAQKTKLLEQLKKLEADYYKKNTLGAPEFKKKKFALDAKISSINARLVASKK